MGDGVKKEGVTLTVAKTVLPRHLAHLTVTHCTYCIGIRGTERSNRNMTGLQTKQTTPQPQTLSWDPFAHFSPRRHVMTPTAATTPQSPPAPPVLEHVYILVVDSDEPYYGTTSSNIAIYATVKEANNALRKYIAEQYTEPQGIEREIRQGCWRWTAEDVGEGESIVVEVQRHKIAKEAREYEWPQYEGEEYEENEEDEEGREDKEEESKLAVNTVTGQTGPTKGTAW